MQISSGKRPLGVTGGDFNLLIGGDTLSSSIPQRTEGVLCQGWLLKKKRKKMQGYARRYFVLSSQGVLSYALQPSSHSRDQIALRSASITTSVNDRSRSIHIDSANATFHLRALGPADHALWMSALRKFCTVATNPNMEFDMASSTSPRSARASLSRARSLTASWGAIPNAKAVRAAQEMGTTIHDMEEMISDLAAFEAGKKSRSKAHKDKERDKEHHNNKDLFGIFHRKTHGSHSATPPVTPSPSHDVFAIESPSSSNGHPAITAGSPLERLQESIATLKAQQNALLNILEASALSNSGIINSPLMRVSEALSQEANARRHSNATMDSSLAGSLWFDAEEGAEEFVLSAEPTESDPFSGYPAEAEGSEDDSEDEVNEALLRTPRLPLSHQTSSSSVGKESRAPQLAIVRRTKLPAPMSEEDGSLLAVLRKNVGKDLSTVSFPVSFNEPISILQRLAEDLEYSDLLSQAVRSTDPVERMCLVAAFAVSGYACTVHRASRKPFNPMLGETFEDIRMNFVSEKVSHHPPVMACHASGPNWTYWATTSADSKFWGRSLEIINKGACNLQIGDSTHYQWRKPSSFMRNLLVGEKYLTHEGDLAITELSSPGYRCILKFKEGGYWGPSRAVSGTVTSPSGETLAKLDGSWNEGLSQQLDAKGSHLRVLWRAHPLPPDARSYYGFTTFGMSLNEITPDIEGALPPTDSRYRPDQRAMEEGDMDRADEEKAALEEAQRERRRKGQPKPLWFKQEGEDWIYKGGYWEAREGRQWAGCPTLW